MNFKNVSRNQWLVFAVLIALGVASRLYLEIPNFKPVAAFVLFGGFFFRQPALAIVLGFVVLGLSDLMLGGYAWQMMVSVYLSLAVAALLGIAIRRGWGTESRSWGWLLSFVGASLTMSTAFFLLTNGAFWLTSNMYPKTIGGLCECYLAGVPFYRWTCAGDLMFTLVIVGCYALVTSYATSADQSSIAADV